MTRSDKDGAKIPQCSGSLAYLTCYPWTGTAAPQLGSEHFRSAPRTSQPAYDKLSAPQAQAHSRYLPQGGWLHCST
jgi:hypothetical protein